MAKNYFGITDAGKERGNNEDAFIAQTTKSDTIIACVIDGVGGYSGGEIAAALAQAAIIKNLDSATGNYPADLIIAFQQANDSIFSERQKAKEHESMACVATLALVDLNKNEFHYAHVGDTRLYLFRDGSLVKISSDHSFVGFLEDSGRLTEQAAMSHPKRNEINKALGFESSVVREEGYIETGHSPFLPGDLLMICSDGLTDMINKAEITELLTRKISLEEKGRLLIDAANHNGGRDNITVVLVENNRTAVKQQPVMPSSEYKKPHETVKTPVVIPNVNSEPKQGVQIDDPATKKSIWIPVLVILCFAFLALFVWQYWQNNLEKKNRNLSPKVSITKPIPKNKFEQLLQDTISRHKKRDTLFINDSTFKSPITVTSTINIDNDTLYLKGKGNVVLQADTLFRGTGIKIGARCKKLVIDNITLKGFSSGIFFSDNVLQLKRIKFINCTTAVENVLTAPEDQYMNGSRGVKFFTPDTLKKLKKKTK